MSTAEVRPSRNRRLAHQVSTEEWLSYVGDCRQLTEYLAKKSFKSGWFPIKFLDALFRGYGQVVLVNNPLSGVLIAVALTIANPEASLAGFITASVGLTVSLALKQNPATISAGLTVFNPLLIGLVTVSVLPTMYGLQMDPLIWLFMLIAAVLSVYITSAISSILHSLGPYPAPCFTVPFNIVQLTLFVCIINKFPYNQLVDSAISRADVNASTPHQISIPEIVLRIHADENRGQESLDPVERTKQVPEKFLEFSDSVVLENLNENDYSINDITKLPFTAFFEVDESSATSSAETTTVPSDVSSTGNLFSNYTKAYTETVLYINSEGNVRLKDTDQNITYIVDGNSSHVVIDNDNNINESRSAKVRNFPATLQNTSSVTQYENYAHNGGDNFPDYTTTDAEDKEQSVTHSPTEENSTSERSDEVTYYTAEQTTTATYVPKDTSSNGIQNDSFPSSTGDDSSTFANTVAYGSSRSVTHSPTPGSVHHESNTSAQDASATPEVPEPPPQNSSADVGAHVDIGSDDDFLAGTFLNASEYGDSVADTLGREKRAAEASNSTLEHENNTRTALRLDVDWGQVFGGMMLSSSQVYGYCDAATSATIYLAILIFSPTMAAFAACGALLGTLTGLLFSNPPYTDVYAGEWGMQGLLCAAALGGFCYVITVQSAVAALLCALLGTVLKHVLSRSYALANLPIMSMPFNLAAILFLYITSVSDEDFVQPQVLTFPEKHWFDYRQQHRAHNDQRTDRQQEPTKEENLDEEKKLRVSEDEVA